jgi:hypothetical protein
MPDINSIGSLGGDGNSSVRSYIINDPFGGKQATKAAPIYSQYLKEKKMLV